MVGSLQGVLFSMSVVRVVVLRIQIYVQMRNLISASTDDGGVAITPSQVCCWDGLVSAIAVIAVGPCPVTCLQYISWLPINAITLIPHLERAFK